MSSSTAQVYGVRDTMRTLAAMDKTLRTQAIRDIKLAAEPLRVAIAGDIPTSPPLSGWAHKGRTGWTKTGTKVATSYGGRARRERDVWPLVRIKLTGAAGSMFDMAGRASSGQFSEAISRASGAQASRAVWPNAEAMTPAITRAVLGAVEKASKQISRELVERGTR